MRSLDQSALRMYWSSAGCFQPPAGLLPKVLVWSTFSTTSLSLIALPMSEELAASSERLGNRVDRLFADPEMEGVADEGGMDNCVDLCM